MQSSYSVAVEASDGTNTASFAVTVTVTNVDEAPVITGDSEVDYAENGESVVATFTATDTEGASRR